METLIPIFAVILSSATSIILVSKNQKKDLNLEISRKRYELYTEIYRLIDESIKDPKLLFENSYLKKFEDLNPKMKLIASKRVNEEFAKFKNFISTKIQEYKDFLFDNDPFRDYSEEEYFGINPEEMEEYENMKNNFPYKNAPESELVEELINGLLMEMQIDIGAIYKSEMLCDWLRNLLIK